MLRGIAHGVENSSANQFLKNSATQIRALPVATAPAGANPTWGQQDTTCPSRYFRLRPKYPLSGALQPLFGVPGELSNLG